MKHTFLFASIIFISSCGSTSEKTETSKSNEFTESMDTIAEVVEVYENDTVAEKPIAPLFDMHPIPNFMEPYNAIPKSPNIIYYAGNIGNDPISVQLEQKSNSTEWTGKYLYNNNGNLFNLNVDFKPVNDTVYFLREIDDEIKETFVTKFNASNESYEGIWIKGNDTLPFVITPEQSTAEERELFIHFANGSFYNSSEELLLNIDDTYSSGTGEFANSYCKDQMGSAYDFGEEWTVFHQKIIFKEEKIIFVEMECNNGTSAVFVEGKEPDGPEDTEYEVEGIEHNSNNKITYQVIKDDIIEEDELILDYSYNSDVWIMNDYILIQLSRDAEQGELIKYKWHEDLEEFVLQN